MFKRPGQTASGWRILSLFLFLLLFTLRIHAQVEKDKKITIHLPQQPLPQTLKQLAAATGTIFAFDEQQLKDVITGPWDFKEAGLGQLLEKILKGTGYGYKAVNGNKAVNGSIVISANPKPVNLDPAYSRPAGLRGRIVDFESSQPLPGATVMLEPTGRLPHSTEAGDSIRSLKKTLLTDERGFFSFRNIPEGIYFLTVTYSGYQKDYHPGIQLNEGKDLVLDVKMQAGSSLNEVVITSGPRKVKAVTHSTEKEIIAEIRNATGVVSGISNEMITKTGDRNAAEVVKRISGVTVVDDRFIVVRGMNERYNLTYLNNNVAPSTELYSKAFAYDLLPSSIIDKILVYKSPVADLVADYGGAAIRIFTKNAMPVRHLDIGVQQAHRPGSTLTTINSYNGGKYDFLGFDDGTRKLPAYSPGYFHTEQRVNDLKQADMLKAFSSTLNYGTRHSLPDMQFFINYYNSWKAGGEKRLYDLTSVTYTHETKNYTIYRQTGNTDAYGSDSTTGLNYNDQNKIINSQQSTSIGKINILENLTLKWNRRNSIEFRNFFVNEGRSFTGVTDGRLNALPHYDSSFLLKRTRDIVLSFQQRFLYSGNIGGTHNWGARNRQELNWNTGYIYDLQNVPDQRASHFASFYASPYTATGTNLGPDDGFLGMISRLFVKNEENVYNASVDYSLSLNKHLLLKIGTYQMYKLRNVGRRFYRVNRGGLSPDDAGGGITSIGYGGGYGLSNPNTINFTQQQLGTIWNPAFFPDDNTGLKLYDVTNPTDSYVASEQNNAFYVMGDWKIAGEKITLNTGLRVEYDRQKVASAINGSSGGSITLAYANHPLTSWLPSVNISYRPSSTIVLRTGYGRTVNRPEFREISAYQDFDFQNNEVIQGASDVVTATIDNYDFRVECYPRSAAQNEMINAGIFYKYLQNPIERLRAENTTGTGNSNFTQITFGNAKSAKVVGVEAEIRKSLSFIGGSNLFKNLSLVANGAWMKSTTVQVIGNNGSQRDTVEGRPLQGQSPYIVNGGLFYENAGWGTKLGIVYNVNGPRIYAKSILNRKSKLQATGNDSVQIRPDLVQLPFQQLDLSFSQRIIKSLQVKFTLQNLLDQAARIIEDHNFNQRYDPEKQVTNPYNGEKYYTGDNIYNRYKPGRYFLVQFTYAF
jgi:outer membrane receptor for ferrienterochelin and colicin